MDYKLIVLCVIGCSVSAIAIWYFWLPLAVGTLLGLGVVLVYELVANRYRYYRYRAVAKKHGRIL